MTQDELRKILFKTDDPAFVKFLAELGGNLGRSRETVVSEFRPDNERRLCYLLKQPTEEEKRTQAATISAEAATTSAQASKKSALASIVSAIVALLAAIAAWCRTC